MAFDAQSGNGGVTPPQPVTPNSTRIMPPVPQAARTRSASTRAQQPAGAHRAPTHMAPSKAASNAGDSAPREPKNRKHGKIAAAIVGGVVVVAYIAGVIAFSNIYYPNTSIAGVDVSLATANTAAERIESSLANYSMHLTGCGMDWTFTPAKGTFSIDAKAEAQAVLAGDSAFLWPVKLIRSLAMGNAKENLASLDETTKATYDKDAFNQELSAAIDAFNQDRPGTFDAAGAYDADAGKFTVEKARSSQRINADTVTKAATKAIEHAQSTCSLDDSAYEPLAGGATDEQLQKACDAANELLGVNVNLKMGGATVATLNGAQMCKWITFDDSLKPTLNHDQLAEWIHNLAVTKLDTAGSERTYTRPDGKQVTIGGGTYGWISDEASLAQMIQDAVANKQTGDIDIPTKQTAAKYTDAGQPDWGAYVDVDLSEQHARYYDADGNLKWESGIISGNPNEGNASSTGIYSINNKERNVKLTGKKDPETGEPIYISYVDYWMSFIGGAVGLHDANWQASSSFSNPNAYLSVGSHGCINLPPSKAAELYDMINVGDCVVVHN
ncbi:MAG: L,D-transpeptidase family protein [Collinsella bouchesdurhonensis]|nr:L,D-transpeptidase family protein [Collinsella bouchesdurhonensis]